ncbi:hypothetical protein PV08_09680 [Exophiala spinifera]|uniref:Fungal N-terminal domain-containing protein n=1 Tax=Exophiala spinifera TaxID=91928 RepID=A0A0D2B0C0_9EURO|nr:uncharacterized protein PV08_09680 [Exophiala spinifera]KIW12403.1 hypothetical protein PV08_09680 [Exophiala spinifera]
MDGGTVSAAAVSSATNAVLRVSQIIYELIAVGEQARDLLAATKHVAKSLDTTRHLRRCKSMHLEATEKEWIDSIMVDASKTLNNVATLVESVRVDMQTKHGKIGLVNRGLFVFRDSPKIPTQLTQLSIASQSLNTALTILSQREGQPSPSMLHHPKLDHRRSTASLISSPKQPPNYEESEFLNRRRRSSNTSSLLSPVQSPNEEPLSTPGGASVILEDEDTVLRSNQTAERQAQFRPHPAPPQIDNEKIVISTEHQGNPLNRGFNATPYYSSWENDSSHPDTTRHSNTVWSGHQGHSQADGYVYKAYNPWLEQLGSRSRRPSHNADQNSETFNSHSRAWPQACDEPFFLPQHDRTSSYEKINSGARSSLLDLSPGNNIPHLPGQSGLNISFPLTPPGNNPGGPVLQKVCSRTSVSMSSPLSQVPESEPCSATSAASSSCSPTAQPQLLTPYPLPGQGIRMPTQYDERHSHHESHSPYSIHNSPGTASTTVINKDFMPLSTYESESGSRRSARSSLDYFSQGTSGETGGLDMTKGLARDGSISQPSQEQRSSVHFTRTRSRKYAWLQHHAGED